MDELVAVSFLRPDGFVYLSLTADDDKVGLI
jgi:hypothetical protein